MKEIELSKTGKNKGKYVALVDDNVFEEVNKYGWSYNNGYARNMTMNIYLHVYIWKLKMGSIPEGLEVDHKDQNKLNCQLSNLRLATHAQNNRNRDKLKNNTSGYIGVSKYVRKRERKNGSISINKNWYCQWRDNLGKRRVKPFPFNNAGKVLAGRYYDIMISQFAKEYQGELNFNSLEEYQQVLKQAILEDIKSN